MIPARTRTLHALSTKPKQKGAHGFTNWDWTPAGSGDSPITVLPDPSFSALCGLDPWSKHHLYTCRR